MWILRSLRSLQENFAFWLLGLLVAEGIIGLVMMFIFPPMSLAMVFLGLITLALAIVIKFLLGGCIEMLARLLGDTSASSTEPERPLA